MKAGLKDELSVEIQGYAKFYIRLSPRGGYSL